MAEKTFNVPEGATPHLKSLWAELPKQYEYIETLKFNQANRGLEGLQKRMAHRAATHKSWRQMKGMERVMYEMSHKGNYPFVIGFGVMTAVMMNLYFSNRNDPEVLAASKYYQRFHAKNATPGKPW